MHIDGPFVDEAIASPHATQDLVASQSAPLIPDKVVKELVLGWNHTHQSGTRLRG